jgi:tetratricopeptide (TPR) repeat protein
MSNENKNNNENIEQQTTSKHWWKKLLDLNPTYKLQVINSIKKFIIVLLVLYIFLVNLNSIIFNFSNIITPFYSKSEDYTKLEHLLEKTLYLQLHTPYKNTFLINQSIKNLINFYNNQLLYEKSEKLYIKYFSFLFDFYNQNTSAFYDNSNINLAWMYCNIGDIKLKLKKYKEAEECYKKALELKAQINHTTIYSYWIELNKLARLKIKKAQYSEAEDYLNQSIKEFKSYSNDLSWEIIYNLSLLNKKIGNYKLAEDYAQYLLLHSPSLPDFYPVPNSQKRKTKFLLNIMKLNSIFKENLADIYILNDRNDEAEKLLKESLLISENLYGENSICTLCNHYKLHKLYRDISLKEKEYKKIFDIKQKILGIKNFQNSELLDKLEIICDEMEYVGWVLTQHQRLGNTKQN